MSWDGKERRSNNIKLESDIALQAKDIEYIKEKVKHIDDKLTSSYVTRNEFVPIKNIVYGMVGTILLAVLGALMTLIIGGGK